ncbi:MAG: Crp/Fnr family transcriptional regulator [Chloroflexi bacterium]|nr:Crp/Fnr family transcriptional regulator [Chloroflexota bacterium]
MFSDLDKAHLLELSRFARQRHLKAREFLFFAGDTLECCYLIASGRIKLLKHSFSGKDFITGAYGAGEMLSTTLLFTGKTHPSSAQAMIDSKVLVIKNDSFVSFLHRFPELGIGIVAKILDAVGGRHQAATVQLSELAAERAEYRLARVLSTLSLKFGSSIPFSRHEIGEMAGTSTETAARFVARLSRGGVVRSTRGRIVVMHPNKLRLLAEAQLSA